MVTDIREIAGYFGEISYMEEIISRTGTVDRIYTREISLGEPFIDFAGRFTRERDTVCLLSGGDLDCSRYHILAAKPWLVFRGDGNSIQVASGTDSWTYESDPFDALRFFLDRYSLEDDDFPAPIACGLFGYLSYDLKDSVETLPRTSVNDLGLPEIYFTAPSIIVVHDKVTGKTTLCIPVRSCSGETTLQGDLEWFRAIADSPPPQATGFSGDGSGFRSNFDKRTYMECIKKIREYITAGDIYQVNMSQRFQAGFKGNAYELFKTLYTNNPAPFFAYVDCGDHQIVSTSPERFICQNKHKVESRPIKGTRPRGKTAEEDQRLKTELQQSKKDDAELSMIVDLIRNDIGKVCKGGSVHVTEHKRVEAYKNVFHLISIVEGELDEHKGPVDLIKATFPGGSITGCPKIRSMEIIDELETHRRHIYTGSIGYISFHGTMDFSIAIRTATVCNDKIIFSVGGGVVFDSDPADEYDETIHKGQTLLNALTGSRSGVIREPVIWHNGALKPAGGTKIPVSDLGFQYGYGCFETIRVDHGKIGYLDEHIKRLNFSWHHLFDQEPADLTWRDVIGQVIDANGLENQVAAVKIIATKGSRAAPPYDNTLVVMARPYAHRLEVINKKGIELKVSGNPRHTHLAAHKSLNYLYYYLEGKEAAAEGRDEALILNTDGSVSETNTANIVFVKGTTVVVPKSGHVLPGVMFGAVIEVFKKWNYTIEIKPVLPEEVNGYDQVILTNSLMGAVPVVSIGGRELPDASWLCAEINREVLSVDD